MKNLKIFEIKGNEIDKDLYQEFKNALPQNIENFEAYSEDELEYAGVVGGRNQRHLICKVSDPHAVQHSQNSVPHFTTHFTAKWTVSPKSRFAKHPTLTHDIFLKKIKNNSFSL